LTEGYHLQHLRNYLEHAALKNVCAATITPGDVKSYRQWRLKSVGSVTVNKEVATLSCLFSYGVEVGAVAGNPVVGIKPLPVEALPEFHTLDQIKELLRTGVYTKEDEKRLRRARILTQAEIETLLRLSQDYAIHVALAVAAYTGARRGEIARLTWADVRFEKDPVMVFRSRKQSRTVVWTPRRVPVDPRLLPILKAHATKTGGQGYLFTGKMAGTPRSTKTMSSGLDTLIAGTDFEGIGWHTFRHSMASNMAMAGSSTVAINQILGHTTEDMARRYRHLLPDYLRGEVERLVPAAR
jgi:integrase